MAFKSFDTDSNIFQTNEFHWDHPFGSHISFPLQQTSKYGKRKCHAVRWKELKSAGKLDEIRSDTEKMESRWLRRMCGISVWHASRSYTKDPMCVQWHGLCGAAKYYLLIAINSIQSTDCPFNEIRFS